MDGQASVAATYPRLDEIPTQHKIPCLDYRSASLKLLIHEYCESILQRHSCVAVWNPRSAYRSFLPPIDRCIIRTQLAWLIVSFRLVSVSFRLEIVRFSVSFRFECILGTNFAKVRSCMHKYHPRLHSVPILDSESSCRHL